MGLVSNDVPWSAFNAAIDELMYTVAEPSSAKYTSSWSSYCRSNPPTPPPQPVAARKKNPTMAILLATESLMMIQLMMTVAMTLFSIAIPMVQPISAGPGSAARALTPRIRMSANDIVQISSLPFSSMSGKSTLYVIDGSSQMYRAYHAPVRTTEGGLL